MFPIENSIFSISRRKLWNFAFLAFHVSNDTEAIMSNHCRQTPYSNYRTLNWEKKKKKEPKTNLFAAQRFDHLKEHQFGFIFCIAHFFVINQGNIALIVWQIGWRIIDDIVTSRFFTMSTIICPSITWRWFGFGGIAIALTTVGTIVVIIIIRITTAANPRFRWHWT